MRAARAANELDELGRLPIGCQALKVSRASFFSRNRRSTISGTMPLTDSAEGDDFLHETGADVGVGLSRHHEDRLDIGAEAAVHERHLHLVLEIRHGAQSPDNHARLSSSSVVHEQSVEGVHFHVGPVAEDLARDVDPLVHGEERRLVGVEQDGDDDPVEEARPALDDVYVTHRDRIERAGVDGDDWRHRGESLKSEI